MKRLGDPDSGNWSCLDEGNSVELDSMEKFLKYINGIEGNGSRLKRYATRMLLSCIAHTMREERKLDGAFLTHHRNFFERVIGPGLASNVIQCLMNKRDGSFLPKWKLEDYTVDEDQ